MYITFPYKNDYSKYDLNQKPWPSEQRLIYFYTTLLNQNHDVDPLSHLSCHHQQLNNNFPNASFFNLCNKKVALSFQKIHGVKHSLDEIHFPWTHRCIKLAKKSTFTILHGCWISISKMFVSHQIDYMHKSQFPN